MISRVKQMVLGANPNRQAQAKRYSLGATLALLASLQFGVSSDAVAQQQRQQAKPLNSIEVTVNDRPISSLDISERLYFMLAISGGVKTQAEFDKLREQVLESLINEILQLQEAEKYKVKISNNELEEYFARRAQMIGATPPQFEQELLRIGSSKRSFLKQIEAEIAWSRLVQGLLADSIAVLDEEVDATIDRIKANKGKIEYRLAEILLLINNAAQENSIKQTAQQLVSNLRSSSAKFGDIARQISASSTASVGGDLGWVLETDIEPDLLKILKNMDLQDVTDPIRTAGSYRIYLLNDRRKVLMADANDAILTIKRLHLTTQQVQDTAKVAAFEAAIKRVKEAKSPCDQATKEAADLELTSKVDVGQVQQKSLTGQLRKILAPAQAGFVSDIVKDQQGQYSFVLCKREMPTIPDPDFDQVLEQLQEQRLAIRARRHLRDLRRSAIIDER